MSLQKTARPQIPLFEKYTVGWLSDHTPYSVDYLAQISQGTKPVTTLFRRKMALTLKKSEEELFGKSGE